MAQQRLGIIMNGVTGRMGMNQHLIRSINAIRDQGGVALRNGDMVMPDPILVGRNERKLAQLAKENGVARWTTDLDGALKNPDDTLFFDAATTKLRASLLHKAIAAGKNIYCEKPIAETLDDALNVARAAKKAGIKHGVVQDKLFLPGLLKLKMLIDAGFFGRIFMVRGEFGYWVFEGDWQPAQRPSWNYRKQETAAASFWICSATGATCSTICSAKSRASPVLARPTSPGAGTRTASLTMWTSTTPLTPRFSSQAALSRISTARGARACAATIS
jgi:predicted dehydrogenase